MSLAERIKCAARTSAAQNVGDKYDAEATFLALDKMNSIVAKVMGIDGAPGVPISDAGMRILVDLLRNTPADIDHAIATAIARRKYANVVAQMKKINKLGGADKRVSAYVIAEHAGKERRSGATVEEIQAILQTAFKLSKKEVEMVRPMLVQRLHALAGLGTAESETSSAAGSARSDDAVTPIPACFRPIAAAIMEVVDPGGANLAAASTDAEAAVTFEGADEATTQRMIGEMVDESSERSEGIVPEDEVVLSAEDVANLAVGLEDSEEREEQELWDAIDAPAVTAHPDGVSSRGRKRNRPRVIDE